MAASRNKPSSDLLKRVADFVAARLSDHEPVAVGLSGGCDSVVLLHLLSRLGLGERLHAIHLNDSLNVRGSHKDRHACIGAGNIGLGAMTRIINHPALRNLPFYLETPNELPGYANEIALLRSKYL